MQGMKRLRKPFHAELSEKNWPGKLTQNACKIEEMQLFNS